MSRISEYNGTDPNGTTSTMTSIHMVGAAYLSIVTIPSDGEYTIGFWICAAGQFTCNLSVDEITTKEFDVYRDWTRVEHTFKASANQQVALYLPAGDYYIWHAKLESGNKATDYSQSYQDMNDQIKSTENKLRAEINITAESISQIVSESQSKLESRMDLMAGKVILQIDDDGNIAAIELGAGEDEKGTVIQLSADNIKFEAGELIELLTDGNLNLTGKKISITSDNFEVDEDGTITCKAGTIGCLTIDGEELTSDKFSIDKDGNITCTGGTIGCLTIEGKKMTSTSSNFGIDEDGKMSCNNAKVSGDINASTLNIIKANKWYGRMDYGIFTINRSFEGTGGGTFESCGISLVNTSYGYGSRYTHIGLGFLGDDNVVHLPFYIIHDKEAGAWNEGYGMEFGGWITAQGYSNTSTRLAKENVESLLDEEARKILDVNVVSFDYSHGGNKNQRGVIYEEVKDIIPSVTVCQDKDYEEHFREGKEYIFPGVDYSKFVPYLIKMVQIQQDEINELKQKLEKISSKL